MYQLRMATLEVHGRRDEKENIGARARGNMQIAYSKRKAGSLTDDYETSFTACASSSSAMASTSPASMEAVAGALPLPWSSESEDDMWDDAGVRDMVGTPTVEVRARRVRWRPLRGFFAGGGFSGSSSIMRLDAWTICLLREDVPNERVTPSMGVI